MFHNGHHFVQIVDGEPRTRRIDRRVVHTNRNCRTNMRNRWGKRSALHPGQVLDGTHYNAQLTCTMCLEVHPRDLFQNRTVQPNIRYNNGMNIRCRYCIDKLKTCGYSVNAFIEQDDDEKEDGEEDDDEEEEEKKEEEEEFIDSSEEDTEEEKEDKEEEEAEFIDAEADTEEEEEFIDAEEDTEEEKEDTAEEEVEEEVEEEEEEEEDIYYNVEQILEHKLVPAKSGTFHLMLLIKWEGYTQEHNTWEPYKELRHTTVFEQYNASHNLIQKE
jgi:hypothetical protein